MSAIPEPDPSANPGAPAMPAAAPQEAKLTLRLSSAAREAVNEIMELGGFRSVQEAIRRSIGDELFLLQHRKAGWTVLLRKDNEYRELVWTDLK